MDAFTAYLLQQSPPPYPDDVSQVLHGDRTWAPGGTVRLFDSTLTAAAASFDITAISQAYSMLQLELLLRGDAAASGVAVDCHLNNDTSGNYDYDLNTISGGVLNSTSTGSAAGYMQVGRAPGGSATANYAGQATLVIPAYTQTTFYKQVRCVGATNNGGTASELMETLFSGVWKSTAAVTEITIYPSSGNWAAGSRATLYGIA